MKKIIITAVIMAAAVSASVADDAKTPVRRIEGLEWQKVKLAAPKEDLVRQELSDQQVRRLSPRELPPLVAYQHPDGRIEIRHASEAQVKQSRNDQAPGEQE